MRGLDRILELQELDTAIDRLDHRRELLEAGEELSAIRKEMEEADARLGEIRLASDAVASESRRLEHEIETMNLKLEAEQKRMYDGSIANPKELEALQHEIASLKERRTRAEDDLLEQMVRKEDLDARGDEADKDANAARARAEDAGGDAVKELDQVGVDLAARHAEREAVVPAFDEELLELYDELRRSKHGVVDGVCQACHEKLSAVELDRLQRTEGVKRCEYCRRIVVFA
jgi:predicted  nucleic acid-binding Zn-ribbon protein